MGAFLTTAADPEGDLDAVAQKHQHALPTQRGGGDGDLVAGFRLLEATVQAKTDMERETPTLVHCENPADKDCFKYRYLRKRVRALAIEVIDAIRSETGPLLTVNAPPLQAVDASYVGLKPKVARLLRAHRDMSKPQLQELTEDMRVTLRTMARHLRGAAAADDDEFARFDHSLRDRRAMYTGAVKILVDSLQLDLHLLAMYVALGQARRQAEKKRPAPPTTEDAARGRRAALSSV